ncbi:MAG: transcription elongation factor GreA [Opitutales bacterium]
MNPEAVKELIEKNPHLKPVREKLEEMQPGRYCIHQSWGFGRIKDYLERENKLIIDFKDKESHAMDPAFCVNTLEVLPEKHLLARMQSEPDVIQEMVNKKPVELVIEALSLYPNRAATGIELESVFTRLLGAPKFKKWWTATKKALAKDPRIAVPVKKSECYYVREDPINNEEEILENFEGTQSAKRKIKLVEELLDVDLKQEGIAERIQGVLENFNTVIRESNQLDSAERVHAAWIRNDLAAAIEMDSETFEPSPGTLIQDTDELEDIAEALPSNLQKRFLKLVKETHPGDWKDHTFDLLKTSQGKFTTECISFLMDNGCEKELGETLKRWLTEQNLRAPLLQWIVKNRHSRKFSAIVHDLQGPRLLNAIFFAIDYEALQITGARKIPLAEILSEDKELISDLLVAADTETARDLANNLIMNQGFEELTKKSLLARFIRHFPSVQTLLAGETEEKEERLVVSRPSYERRREEYDTLVSKKIPENSKAIAVAREHGDLKENSEYKMAKQDQQVLLSRKSQLERDLSRAEISDFTDAPVEQVGIGSKVSLKEGSTGPRVTYSLLGAWDSDPENNVISYQTPLGQSLLGHKEGETIEVKIGDNEEKWTIESISLYTPRKQKV